MRRSRAVLEGPFGLNNGFLQDNGRALQRRISSRIPPTIDEINNLFELYTNKTPIFPEIGFTEL